MKHIIILTILLIQNHLFSQKEDYIWMGGYQTNVEGTGANGYMFDFNNGKRQISYANPWYGFDGNNASICDQEGNLLFYTNGRGVMNKNHQLMPHGDSINADPWADKLWPNPFRGYPGAQDVLILPDPADDNGFYLFHKKNIYYPMFPDSQALNYTYIDRSLDNGLGDVVVKNVKYYDHLNALGNYFTAMRHQNKKDWWLIQPITNDSVFLTFLLDESGIHRLSNQNSHKYFTTEKTSASGTSKFSPDGTKYAMYNENDKLLIYDFDRTNGTLKFMNKIITHDTTGQGIFCSVEWSPDSRFIYTATSTKLHQVDTWASNLQTSVTLIDTYNGTLDPFITTFFLMVQGPDCKIYMSPKNGSNSIHVINKPNEKGKACDFVQNGIKPPYPNGGEMPNFPRFRVDEEEKCDPTISSVFGNAVYYRRDMQVYPNPSVGNFTIKLPEHVRSANLVVTNVNGQILFQKEWQHTIIETLDITHLPAGRYNIEVYPTDRSDRVFYGKQVIKVE